MVYLKFEMKRKVVLINPSQRPPKDLAVRKAVMLSLLEDLTCRKASEQQGYYLAVHTLESIGEGEVHSPTGDIILPVTFTCIAIKPVKGDIFIGTVDKVLKQGAVLKYGPMEDILLSEKEMKGYGYDGRVEEEPEFVNESLRFRIGSGGRVRFTVAGSKWIESERVFQVQATLGDDGVDGVFGPVEIHEVCMPSVLLLDMTPTDKRQILELNGASHGVELASGSICLIRRVSLCGLGVQGQPLCSTVHE